MAVATSGLIAEFVGKLAKNGTGPASNPSDLTWDCLTNSAYDGTLTTMTTMNGTTFTKAPSAMPT